MKRILKESVQKMNGRKKYKGELYSFFRSERNIGSGGNGAVYDVEFEGDEGFEFPIVAKFFEYGGVDKEKRYKYRHWNRRKNISLLRMKD